MAFESILRTVSIIAGADLRTAQYKCVKLNAALEVILCTTIGEDFIGILQNAPNDGEYAQVAVGGVSKAIFGATIDGEDRLMTNASALLVPATAGYFMIGYPMLGGVVNDIGSVNITFSGYIDTGSADHAAVLAATAHITSDGSDHTFIDQDVTSGAAPVFDVTNMTGSAAGLDSDATAHASGDGSDHTFIDQDVTSGAAPVFAVTNMTGSAAGLDSDATAHAAADGMSHSAVVANATDLENLVDVVILAAGGVGGATAGTIDVQVNDLAGSPVAKVCELLILVADSEYGGLRDLNANVTFGAASAGSVLATAAGWAVIKTDATGNFVGATANAADETVYYSACVCDGGQDAVGAGVLIRGCVPDDATWSA